jgi:phage/plasmid primase-like uncharacterized protein
MMIAEFLVAMREHSFEPNEEIIADGELHRIQWVRDRDRTRSGAYVLRLDRPPAEFVQCFKHRIRVASSANGARLSPVDRKALTARTAKEKQRREWEERKWHKLIAIVETCQVARPDHACATDRARRTMVALPEIRNLFLAQILVDLMCIPPSQLAEHAC